ncbi:MAG: tetratricopeptide repeat protein [Terriglobia bacterium]
MDKKKPRRATSNTISATIEQFDRAIGQYLTTLKLDPNYKHALRDLALLYLARGNESEAMKLIPQLAKLNPRMSQQLQMIIQKQ